MTELPTQFTNSVSTMPRTHGTVIREKQKEGGTSNCSEGCLLMLLTSSSRAARNCFVGASYIPWKSNKLSTSTTKFNAKAFRTTSARDNSSADVYSRKRSPGVSNTHVMCPNVLRRLP